MAIITISRQFGAGGVTLGKQLAEKLGYTFIDQEVIELIAEKSKISTQGVESFEKETSGKLKKIISDLAPKQFIDFLLEDNFEYLDEKLYVELIENIYTEAAKEDNAVIIGRGSQYILKDAPNAYHLLLIADKDYRVDFMAKSYGLTPTQAETLVTRQGKRRRYLHRLVGIADFDNPEYYHMVLNMQKTNIESAMDLICELIA
jgi:cytidylate kinase